VKDPKEASQSQLPMFAKNELCEGIDGISRRRFLSLLSASAALAMSSSSCSRIDRGTIVPYTRKPGETIPGVASYYASTFQEGLVAQSVLVKTREGRPIHIEANAGRAASNGAISLRAMGDLLGLYDPDRLSAPSYNGATSTWEEAEKMLVRSLSDARLMEKPVLLLTNAIISPTQKALISDLKMALPGLYHAAWEPNAPESEIQASKALYGEARISALHLERASTILSLQSDFLGTDANAPEYIRSFAAHRTVAEPTDAMNRLWAIEGSMTLTGSNADQRLQVRPSKMARVAFTLARILSEAHSLPLPSGLKAADLRHFELEPLAKNIGIDPSIFRRLAADLARAGKSALVISGSALQPDAHVACHVLNMMLGAEGNTVDLAATASSSELLTFAGLRNLFKDAAGGKFAVGIIWGANPAYAFPDRNVWKNAISKIPETYRIGLYEDETALDCTWRLPEHHWLESWGDFESGADFIALRQPVIGPIYDSRLAEELLLACLRKMKIQTSRSYLEYLKYQWRAVVYSPVSPVPFELFWNAALHEGGVKRESIQRPPLVMNTDAVKNALDTAGRESSAGLELVLAPDTGVYDGRYANNGWLNELPDPVTKATWCNPILISSTDAERLQIKDDDVVRVFNGSETVEVPVIVQPGQAPGVAALALGYGRRTGNVASGIGVNAYPLIDIASSSPYLITGINISRKENGGRRAIPRRQTHNRMAERDHVRSWTLAEFLEKIRNKETGDEKHTVPSLVPELEFPGHKWGMVIDLSACVGCSACVVACQSENNVPVVGPERILAGRDMHWIRIDRYYEGDLQNPVVLHQPMLCQQCDNAPCEIVCPVNATTHSPDGLNQMAYNRCVGTRYCSNNCPFKVRRFNFFDYTSMKKAPENLVYNPEVTVRPRGVMEKCTFCIQRIQNARQKARSEGRQILDGEIQPACAASCPAGAFVFGDLNDDRSRVAKLSKGKRGYRMLEELGIKPSITYLADISNPPTGKGKA
jgi:Fe-S-cluster-containing dehydrogenase component/anaerobic selenocysteine-containing dehydrogenase